MDDLKLIYDFTHQSPRIGMIAFPLLFIAIGLIIFYCYKNNVNKSATSTLGVSKRKYGMFFGILFASVAALFSAFVITSNLNDFRTTNKILTDKKYKTVEGKVENYHPMPEGGHDTERFTVDSVQFAYSDYDLTDYGYNNSASKGGAIKENLYVRIAYFNNGNRNVILRLETK